MLTRKEMVDRLNQLTLKYNLTWEQVRFDMAKALDEINFLMGTDYPKFEDKLINDNSTYTIRIKGVDREIIKEEYFHSVIFPYVAMEILAREEEFTTVYSKYEAELEKGKFKMFSNEFNHVPDYFKRSVPEGVMFPTGHPRNPINHNKPIKVDRPEFRIRYHINNDEMIKPEHFVEDTNLYSYNDKAIILDYGMAHFSHDGLKLFTFAGWKVNKYNHSDIDYVGDAEIVVKDDLDLYAMWNEEYTVRVSDGVLSIKQAYRESIPHLHIPEYVGGQRVTALDTEFLQVTSGTSNLNSIILPASISLIKERAFSGYKGSTIEFTEHDITPKYPALTIKAGAFEDTENLANITLPYALMYMEGKIFPEMPDVQMHRTINIRRSKDEMKALNHTRYTDIETEAFGENSGTYTRTVNWGYSN